ncbi:MAG: WcaI family glycosyltransferase [Mucilaginibacter sp.]|uniref:WcaI family glycosyltransferase n=1 Tax=Mucilaginibacter sp. TaxID=1882438 RepID=UPI003267E9FB
MKKKVLLIGHNFSPEPTGIGKYSGDMMDWFAKNGYDCTVVTTFPYYPYWKVQPPYKNRFYKKEVIAYPESASTLTIYRCPLYIPAKPTGKTRMLQDISFWISMVWVVLKLTLFNKKHDYIITVAPPFHLGYLAWFYRKIKGGKLIYHIQDLQIDAAQELNMLSNDRLFKIIYALERRILIGSDFVSTISEGMVKKVKSKIDRNILLFPNWVDVSSFYPIADKAGLKEKWGYRQEQFICLYSGSIGHKQGLENIVFCAEILREHKNIKFIICGTGPYKYKLEELVNEKQLTNVDFLPLQDKNLFNAFLNMADIHLVIQKGNASDLVMPSKLTTILAIGGSCIITSPSDTSLYNLVKKYSVGFIIPPDDFESLKTSVLSLVENDVEVYKRNARAYAEKYLNIDNVMNQFVKEIA